MFIRTIKKHIPYLTFVFILYVLVSIGIASVFNWYDPPFSRFSDLTIHIPRALKLSDPTLFERDPVFTAPYPRLDALAFPLFLSLVLPVFGIRWTLIIFAFILGLIFVIGVYGLAYYLSGDSLVGLMAAFLGCFSYRGVGWIDLNFTPEYMLPRNFIVAVSPLIILLFLHWRTDKKLWVVYACLGLMANFHALAPLHLVFILTLTLIATSRPSWFLLKQVAVAGCAALIFALPSVVYFLPHLIGVVTVTSDEAVILLTRYAETLRPRWVDVLLLGINFLPLALCGGLGFHRAFKQQKKPATTLRVYLVLYVVVLLLPWVGVMINTFTLSFRQLELLRITRYYYLLNFAPAGMLLTHWLKKRGRYARVLLPVVLITITIFSRHAVGVAIILNGYDWLNPPQTTTAKVENKDSFLEVVWNWEAFSDLTGWIDANTPIDALFMTPVTWTQFGTYARRSMLVNDKGIFGPDWVQLSRTVQKLYTQPDAEKFIEVVEKNDVDYVIVMPGLTLPEMDIVYKNEYYVIYKTR